MEGLIFIGLFLDCFGAYLIATPIFHTFKVWNELLKINRESLDLLRQPYIISINGDKGVTVMKDRIINSLGKEIEFQEKQIKQIKTDHNNTWIGISLLVCGFFLQGIGNYFS